MVTSASASTWFKLLQPQPLARRRIFCFPYAGGSSSIYQHWPSTLPPDLEIYSVQLPGREGRYFEPPFTRLEPLIHALADAAGPYLDRPFVCFGHSMGALIGFELARELRRRSLPTPERLYVSAFRAPHTPSPHSPLHVLPDAEFLAELARLDGAPEEIWQDVELRQLMLPVLRADFALCESYSYVEEPPLDCSIVVFGGLDDREVGRDALRAWEKHTNASCRLAMVPGNHFFIHSSRSALLQTLAQDLGPAPAHSAPNVEINAEEGIAIIGMSCRFPGAATVDAFWHNLQASVESIARFTADDLQAAGVDPSILQHPNYVNARGVIDNVEMFDASFFGYSPREAEILDPQQRLFLECAWEALESAGYDPGSYPGQVGVYAGMAMSRYLFNLIANPNIVGLMGLYQIILANDKDHISTRTAYKLDLRGPAVTVQTTCSTSLVGVAMACQSLLDYGCDMALAGGATIDLPQRAGYFYQEGSISSPDGHCRAFDAEAKGTVGGNGVGAVLLKRLSDAIADGDTIHAIILGSAINNDGALKVGYTAPGVDGQAAVIAMAQELAGVEPDSISYVEAHGTGTMLGDPIEIAALTQAFQAKTARKGFCAIGSLKTNVGHLDTASGVAGLIKTVLALRHRQIPPSLHFQRPNPKIDFAQTPFYVNTQLVEWQRGPSPRRAGVSSFGIGGTNAHVVVQEAPARAPAPALRPYQLLTLSARSRPALDMMAARLGEHLQAQPDLSLADVAYTSHVGRRAFSHRRAFICQDTREAAVQLAGALENPALGGVGGDRERPVAFLFPGQGAQYPTMALGLYNTEALFRRTVDACAEVLHGFLDIDLRGILFPAQKRYAEAELQLRQTWITQPALFVLEYALATLWMEWGVRPSAMIGHSIGEYTAACVAGVFSLEDALAIVAERGRLMQELGEGAMLAVALPERELLPLLGDDLSVAACNAPRECVVAGDVEAVGALEDRLRAEEVIVHRLRTTRAFHSPMTKPVLDLFRQQMERVRLSEPRIPFVSNVTGRWITADEATDPAYWVRHMRQTVRFADGVRLLVQDSSWVLLEVGPGQTLTGLIRQCPDRSPEQAMLPSLRQERDPQQDEVFLLRTLGALWVSGLPIDWARYHADERRLRVPLPTYPFERQRYWVDAARPGPTQAFEQPRSSITDWLSVSAWRRRPLPGQKAAAETDSWLIFADACGLGEQLGERLRQSGAAVTTVSAGPRFARVADGVYTLAPGSKEEYAALLAAISEGGQLPTRIVHLWSVTPDDVPTPEMEAGGDIQERGFYSLTFLAQALGDLPSSRRYQLTVVSNHVHQVNGQLRLYPEKATILGPCIVIPQEYANIQCRQVDVVLDDRATTLLADQLLEECHAAAPDSIVAYRSGERWTRVFEPAPISATAPPRLRMRGVYLITGGLGGIGLSLAAYLAKVVKARLVLVGRTSLPEPAEWPLWLETHDPGDQTTRRIQMIRELEGLGGEVLVAQADVADRVALQEVLGKTYGRFGALHGVIHAAGVAGGGIIQLKTRAEAERVMAPKVAGTLALANLLAPVPLDFFVLCSSLAAVLGGAAQVDYCAANAFLDAFAHATRAAGSWPVIAINWDRWQEVGMAVETQAPADLKHERQRGLWQGLRVEEGVAAFERILTSTEPQVAVASFDLRAVLGAAAAPTAPTTPAGASDQPRHPRPAMDNPYVQPETDTERAIAGVFEMLIGISTVGRHDHFFTLGGHSLLAIQLISRLREMFNVELSTSAVFASPTVAELAATIETIRWASQTGERPSEEGGEAYEEGEL